MTNEEINYSSNMAYIIGLYESRLKMVAQDVKDITTLNEIKATLELGNKIWENKFDKHYTQIK